MGHRKITILFLIYFAFVCTRIFGQEQKIADSLTLTYQQNSLSGNAKFELLKELAFNETRDLKKGILYAEELISLSGAAGNNTYLRAGYFLKGTKHRLLGNLHEALDAFFQSAEIAKKNHDQKAEGEGYSAIADIYAVAKNFNTARQYYSKAVATLRLSTPRRPEDSISLASVLSNSGDTYLNSGNYDSALLYFNEAKTIFDKVNYLSGKGYSLGNIGMVHASIGKNDLAEQNMNEAIGILANQEDYYPICDYLLAMSDVYVNKAADKTALNYALRSLRLAEQYGLKAQIAQASLKLSQLYEKKGNTGEAFVSFKRHIANRDSVNNIKTVADLADLRTNFELSQKQLEVNILNKQKRNERNLSIALGTILGLTILIAIILLKNNQHKQRAYKILHLQKQETDKQKAKAEDALTELQVTQKQLIQTAKMASLGELTAGIAHEIQNPLNFVNNFSEVSVELLGELKNSVLNNSNSVDKGEVDEILKSLTDNLNKIHHHGRKADLIVKGMLQHSRLSTGKKEPVSINALADEYLRLSYRGLKAKDKDFTVAISTSFAENVGTIDIVPQDIGRVLLNLYNNAFYAVNKKKQQSTAAFEPSVSVRSKREGDVFSLSIRDNGIGIPSAIIDKIFQPFFTTKPTGEGTGLGLSLSYDIVKAHGGDIMVNTTEGDFTEFVLQLPI